MFRPYRGDNVGTARFRSVDGKSADKACGPGDEDPVAPADTCAAYLAPLRATLAAGFPRVDPHLRQERILETTAATAPEEVADDTDEVWEAILAGRLVPVLGTGVTLNGGGDAHLPARDQLAGHAAARYVIRVEERIAVRIAGRRRQLNCRGYSHRTSTGSGIEARRTRQRYSFDGGCDLN